MDRSALTGLVVALGALAVATAAGLWWRRRDGRLRDVRPAVPGQRAAVPIRPDEAGAGTPGQGDEPAALAALGVTAGQVTLLQFSSAFCAPCRTTGRVCAEVARTVDGVVHLEVDAESHLAEVRVLGIWRTPTVLVVDTAGRVAHRATGVPGRSQVLSAVAALLPVAP